MLSLASNVIAYVGISNFDGIIYLSRILQKLGRKVLMVDNTESGVLRSTIPQLGDVDSEKTIITYRRVDFTSMVLDQNILDSYDDVLLEMGTHEPLMCLALITKVVYVTDMFEFNRKRIEEIKYYDNLEAQKSLIIKNAIDMKITVDTVVEKLKKNIKQEEVAVLYLDERDYTNSLICNYSKVPRFDKISDIQKNYYLGEVKVLVSDASKKQVKDAYHKAKKGA